MIFHPPWQTKITIISCRTKVRSFISWTQTEHTLTTLKKENELSVVYKLTNLVRWTNQNVCTGLQIFQMNLHIFNKIKISKNVKRKTKKHLQYRAKKERKTDPFDEVRVFDQTKSAPKRVVDGGAMCLELGGESSVNHGTTPCLLYQTLQQCCCFLQPHLSLSSFSLYSSLPWDLQRQKASPL